jgi:hypothetical protein
MTLANLTATRITGLLSFYDENGNALTLPLSFPQSGATVTASSTNLSIDPNASFVVETESAGSNIIVGWADVKASGTLQGYAIFRQRIPGLPDSEGTVALETQPAAGFVLLYDNTTGFQTGIGLANQSTAKADITVNLRDDSGALLGTSQITLPALGHQSFFLNRMFGQTANRRGVVEFRSAAGSITGIGLRFSPAGSFTSVPIVH